MEQISLFLGPIGPKKGKSVNLLCSFIDKIKHNIRILYFYLKNNMIHQVIKE